MVAHLGFKPLYSSAASDVYKSKAKGVALRDVEYSWSVLWSVLLGVVLAQWYAVDQISKIKIVLSKWIKR